MTCWYFKELFILPRSFGGIYLVGGESLWPIVTHGNSISYYGKCVHLESRYRTIWSVYKRSKLRRLRRSVPSLSSGLSYFKLIGAWLRTLWSQYTRITEHPTLLLSRMSEISERLIVCCLLFHFCSRMHFSDSRKSFSFIRRKTGQSP